MIYRADIGAGPKYERLSGREIEIIGPTDEPYEIEAFAVRIAADDPDYPGFEFDAFEPEIERGDN